MYFLGIDGGGSRTRALLCDASGHIIGHALGAATNPRTAAETDLRSTLSELIGTLSAGKPALRIRAAHLGIAGAGDAGTQAMLAQITQELIGGDVRTITVGHDLEIALAGGLAGDPGIVLVAGTGSAAYGRNAAGHTFQCGGWGDLVDDCGSGSWLGLRALQACVRQADGRWPASELQQQVMRFLEIETMQDFKARIHDVGLSRQQRAGCAPIVLNLAASGDPAAGEIAAEAMQALCELTACTAQALEVQQPVLLLAGGLMNHSYFETRLITALEKSLPGAELADARLPPVAGAALLALKSSGVEIKEQTIEKLVKTPDSFN